MAALTLEVAAWVVAWILSWRLLLLSERRRDEGEEGVEEEDGYLTGDTDPFIMENSEEGMVVWPVDERGEIDVLPPLEVSVASTEVFRDERLELLFTAEKVVASVAAVFTRAVLKGRLEL